MTDPQTIILDPLTVMAEQGYPVGGRAKSKNPVVGRPLWGTVVHNDGQTFRVKWDWLEEVHEYDLPDEIQCYHEAMAAFSELFDTPAKDPLEAALGSFGGCDKPGRAYQRSRPDRSEMYDEWCANYRAFRG